MMHAIDCIDLEADPLESKNWGLDSRWEQSILKLPVRGVII
jgi:hypothetical protein